MEEEFRRKYAEFESYSDRTKLQGEEVTDDLYQQQQQDLFHNSPYKLYKLLWFYHTTK